MRTIGVVTIGRSDYGIYFPLLKRIEENPELNLHLIVSGMHLSPEFGLTVNTIKADGFTIGDKVEMLLSSDTPDAIAKSMGLGLIGFGGAFSRRKPDILILLGDRFEMHAAGLAALPFGIPIAHIHGGELTIGAIDDALRHSLTKLSHIHFVSTQEYGMRVEQLGEKPENIHVVGSLSLLNLKNVKLYGPVEFERQYQISTNPPPLLITFHPTSLEYEKAEKQFNELLMALEKLKRPVVFTLPNADTGGRVLINMVKKFVKINKWAKAVDNFGTRGYFSMMNFAAAMVGNSSSGIIEAASLKLPVVNIGSRQKGRVRSMNVIDVKTQSKNIIEGIELAISADFHRKVQNVENPYEQSDPLEKIISVLNDIELGSGLLHKEFVDIKEK